MGQLLHEKGVSPCSAQDEFPELGHHFCPLENGPQQLGTTGGWQLIHTDFVVKGFAPPPMGVFRTVEKDQQDPGICQPPDQIVQKLLRGLVDPVKILYSHEDGFVLTLSNKLVSKGLEGLLPFLLGLQPEIPFILDFER